MDRHIRPGSLPAYPATSETGDLPFRPVRNERDSCPSSNAAVQDLLAIPRPASEQGRHAKSLAQNSGYPRPYDEQWARR